MPSIIAIISIIAALVTAYFIEINKIKMEEYARKEEKYSELISSLKGFYIESLDSSLQQRFIDEYNQCWLYCSDEVIGKANIFLATVVDKKASNDEKQRTINELILEMRKDMLTREVNNQTKLKAEDYKNRIIKQ